MAIPDRVDAGAAARRGAGVVVAGFWVAGAGAGAGVAGAGAEGFWVVGAGAAADGGAGFCCAGAAGACANVSQGVRPARRQLNKNTFRIGSIIVRSMGIIPNGRQGYPGK
jgi:hypothetical protein